MKPISLIICLFSVTVALSAQDGQKFAELEAATIEEVNQFRKSKQLPALEMDAEISALAARHSEAMASGKIRFGHHGFKDRAKLITRTLSAKRVAENVARNSFPHDKTIEAAMKGWMESSGHRKNMLGPFTRTGIGIRQSESGHYYFTQIFAK